MTTDNDDRPTTTDPKVGPEPDTSRLQAQVEAVVIIGAVTTYLGSEHPYLTGHRVKITAVHHGALVSPDDSEILHTDEDISAAGGLDTDSDILEVAPVHADGRVSWVTSDAQAGSLELFREM